MIVPQRMTIPMLARILPKPLFTVSMTSPAGIPHTRPTKIAITVSTRNGCMLNFEIAMTIHTTAKNITPKMNKPDIFIPPFMF